MEPIRCPKCGSTDVTYMNMDGHGMTDQYGYCPLPGKIDTKKHTKVE